MLTFMSKHAKFFYVFFFIIIISFVFFYIGPLDKSGGQLPLITVKKETVPAEEFWRVFENMRQLYRDVYKEKFDAAREKELRGTVLAELVTSKVLSVAARDLGLTVGEREVVDAIVSDPSFQREGAFRKDVYLNILRQNRLTPQYYEERKREELLVRKMRQLIESSVEVSEDDIPQLKGIDPKLLENLRASIINSRKSQAVEAYVESMKKRYGVIVREDLIS